MDIPTKNKTVLLGVTGSIACYKAIDLASKLTQKGANVDVMLSKGAQNFVTPLSFRSITNRAVITDLYDEFSELNVSHVKLPTMADVLVIAPATAHTIAKLALGLADDSITTSALAMTGPIIVAPAMDGEMFNHPTVQAHLKTLSERGVHIVGPDIGYLASGSVGKGRLVEPDELIDHINWILGRNGDLGDKTIVVSAGGTREHLDPVRVLTNLSSGKMGYAIATAARDRGASVHLVSASTTLDTPYGVTFHEVTSAKEMAEAIQKHSQGADILVMAAAVADYTPGIQSPNKLKKNLAEPWDLQLFPTPDILAQLEGPIIKIGFAAETSNLIENATAKLRNKGLHLIVGNDVTDPESGFGTDTNKITMIDPSGGIEELPVMAKYDAAHKILDRAKQLTLK